MIRNSAHPDRSSIIKLLHRHGDAIGGCIVGFWHKPADPECPLSRRVLEGKRTCHGNRGNDVRDPKRSSGTFTRLAYRPLVTDRAMEAWYHLSIA